MHHDYCEHVDFYGTCDDYDPVPTRPYDGPTWVPWVLFFVVGGLSVLARLFGGD